MESSHGKTMNSFDSTAMTYELTYFENNLALFTIKLISMYFKHISVKMESIVNLGPETLF